MSNIDQLKDYRSRVRGANSLRHWWRLIPLLCPLWVIAIVGAFGFDPGPSHLAAASADDGPFILCGSGPRVNCVVDGDTFWYRGQKIRVALIDAPESYRPGCKKEAELGTRATRRFLELLNAGPISLETGNQKRDRYGRAVRFIMRDGRSLGESLVNEGLAKPWPVRGASWCA